MDSIALRNLKDFFLQYNKISESCFLNCVDHLSERSLSQDECRCVDMCTKKFISFNYKVMQVYMEIQPLLINKRIEEMNKQQAAVEEAQKKELEANKSAQMPVLEKPTVGDVLESKKLIDTTLNNDVPNKEIIRTEFQ